MRPIDGGPRLPFQEDVESAIGPTEHPTRQDGTLTVADAGAYRVATGGKVLNQIDPQILFGRLTTSRLKLLIKIHVYGGVVLLIVGFVFRVRFTPDRLRREPTAEAPEATGSDDPFPSQPSSESDRPEQLQKLAELRDSGALNEAEVRRREGEDPG